MPFPPKQNLLSFSLFGPCPCPLKFDTIDETDSLGNSFSLKADSGELTELRKMVKELQFINNGKWYRVEIQIFH